MNDDNDNKSMFKIVKYKWTKKDSWILIVSIIVSILLMVMFSPAKYTIGFKFLIFISLVLILYIIFRYSFTDFEKEKLENNNVIESLDNLDNNLNKDDNIVEPRLDQTNDSDIDIVPNYFSKSFLSEEQEEQEEHMGQEEEHIGQEEEHIGQEEEHIGQEEEHIAQEEEYIGQEEQRRRHIMNFKKTKPLIDYKKKQLSDKGRPDISNHLMSTGLEKKPLKKQAPVNISVSYITKNAVSDSNFAKDDIINKSRFLASKEHFGKPSTSNFTFDTQSIPGGSNRKPNSNYYIPPQFTCNGSGCQSQNNNTPPQYYPNYPPPYQPPANDNNKNHKKHHKNKKHDDPYSPNQYTHDMYSGTGYSYVKPDYRSVPQANAPQNCPQKKCPVCPIELNQSWSKWGQKWNHEQLSGNDIKPSDNYIDMASGPIRSS